ncbi:hypothetical protein AB0H36_30730 [Kribbella sp. NPDC050820]|uniref:hypothetical protein n=1 Tax=Kribbella sp. NPDC050820 TaxID=3155408 RepID=UPI0033D11BB7
MVLILIAFGAGAGLMFVAGDGGAMAMALVGAGFVAAFTFGVIVAVRGMRRWIAGHSVPAGIQLLEWGAVVIGFLITGLVDAGLGWAVIAGLMGGLLSANVWGIRSARANRGLVDRALATRAASASTTPATTTVSATMTEPLTPILRDNVLLERRRAIAWLIAGLIALVGGAVLDLPPVVTITAVVVGLSASLWVLRRLTASWLALRSFTKAKSAPRRAFVILLNDPAPKMLRPLLAVWSVPPALRDGRMPKPEQVYRCDEERDALLSFPGDAVVHEAWISTGRRRRSKPRWVAADAGVALPHRRALFGRWYVGNLLPGERPDEPRPLTLPPPHQTHELIARHDGPPGNLLTASLTRLIGLVALGFVMHWLT